MGEGTCADAVGGGEVCQYAQFAPAGSGLDEYFVGGTCAKPRHSRLLQ